MEEKKMDTTPIKEENSKKTLAEELGIVQDIYVERNDIAIEGIGGWLMIVASIKVIGPILVLAAISKASQLKIALLLRGDTSVPVEYFELTDLIFPVLLTFSVVILILFFKTKRLYPYVEAVHLLFQIGSVVMIIQVLGDVSYLRSEMAELLFLNALANIGVMLYCLKSVRVKNTFIKPFIDKRSNYYRENN